MQKGRSGEIDIFRFLFAVMIMIYHFGSKYDHVIFRYGYIGVEFFFIVTGYLTAMHVDSLQRRDGFACDTVNMAGETWKYTLKKVGQFYRYYFTASLVQLIFYEGIVKKKSVIKLAGYLIEGIPVLTLTNIAFNIKWGALYVTGMWYVSAMVFALFILYPFMLYKFSLSTKWVFPILTVLILGKLHSTFHTLGNLYNWIGPMSSGLLRAIAEMAAGASLYALSVWFLDRYGAGMASMPKWKKVLITAGKLGCFGIVVLFAMGSVHGTKIPREMDLYIFMVVLIGVFLCFSRVGFYIPDSRVTRYLGKLSVAVYFFHGLVLKFMLSLFKVKKVSVKRFSFYCLACFVAVIVLMEAVDRVYAFVKGRRKGRAV